MTTPYCRFSVGDRVQVTSKWGDLKSGTLIVSSIGKRTLKTDDGRSWTLDGMLYGTGMLGASISKVAPTR